jgi:ABC-type transport system substrate-binding protein/class 3 adenylate cyclase
MMEILEERRVVTALFADIVGSTAMGERLDPEETKLVVGDAIARIIRVIEAYGGTIKDLAGDGALALFGAPVAHEDDPVRALRAALEIIDAIAEYAGEVKSGWGIEGFGVRLGVDTGEVVVGPVGAGGRVEYGAVGDVVNTAARLQAASSPGTALVSQRTERLSGGLFDWGPAQSITLRGKAEPVITRPLLGFNPASGRDHLQPVVVPMIGRETELAETSAALDRLRDRRGGILSIIGEPGIGKTRLSGALAEAGAAMGCTWLEGRCASYAGALPYWPFRDVLRSWLGATPRDPEIKMRVALRRRVEKLAPGRGDEIHPYLASVLGLSLEPEGAARLAQLSPEAMQYRTFEVIADLFAAIAADGPLVLSLDDLHWADATSIALIERLLPLTEESPLLVVLLQRPETEQGSWVLREKAAREYRHLFHEIALTPLSETSGSALVEVLVEGAALTDELRGRLLSYAEGNPFYLEELVRSLVERGVFRGGDEDRHPGSEESLTVPTTIEGVILARIDRLDPVWREVVTAASVLGRSFGLHELHAVSGLDEGTVRDSMHHLLRLDLIREESRSPAAAYRFKHALIQETAYRTLVATRRAVLHRRAAEWFESAHRESPERFYGLLAHHYRAAKDTEQAMRYLRLAADYARDEWALDEAIQHYADLVPLLEATGHSDESAELLFQLGTMLHLAMRYREANEVWQQAFRVWQPRPAARVSPTATLRIAGAQIPWINDPALGGFWLVNARLTRQTYDTLAEHRPGPNLVPQVAESWSVSDDGLIYQVRLRPDASWNDGRRVTADDMVWSYRHVLDPDVSSYVASHLSILVGADDLLAGRSHDPGTLGVRALDDRTVEIRLNVPAPHFVFLFAWPHNLMRPDLVANGPFRVASMDSDGVVLDRDPGHGAPRGGNVAQVEWIKSNGPEAVEQLHSGTIDVLDHKLIELGALRDVGELAGEAVSGAPVQTIFIGFSCDDRFATDLAFRRALAYATDRAALELSLPPFHTLATGGLVPPGLPGHTPDIALRFDPDRAREWLGKSGYRGPILAWIPDPAPSHWEALADSWTAVLGRNVERISEPLEQVRSYASKANVGYMHWLAHAPDPGYFLTAQLHTGSRSNLSGWSYPALDALLDAAHAERNGPSRLALFHQADRLAVQDQCAVIPLLYARYTVIAKPWVHGLWEWGANWLSLDQIVVDDRSPRHHTQVS